MLENFACILYTIHTILHTFAYIAHMQSKATPVGKKKQQIFGDNVEQLTELRSHTRVVLDLYGAPAVVLGVSYRLNVLLISNIAHILWVWSRPTANCQLIHMYVCRYI